MTTPTSTSSSTPAAATAGMKFVRSIPRIGSVVNGRRCASILRFGYHANRKIQKLRADDEMILGRGALVDLEAHTVVDDDEIDDAGGARFLLAVGDRQHRLAANAFENRHRGRAAQRHVQDIAVRVAQAGALNMDDANRMAGERLSVHRL